MDFLFELPVTVVVLFLGASVGSFLNVVVYRLPAGLSLLHPPSRCPKCLSRLRKRENVPVLGWFWLRGRCAHCGNPISVRYPLVEGVTGILFVLTFWLFGWSWQTIGYWFFLSWLLVLSLIDLDTMTLPNPLTQSGLIAGVVFQVVLGFSTTATLAGAIAQLMHGVVGVVLGLWLVDLISLVGSVALGQTAMGGGDAKLAAMMGAWLGWKFLLLAGFLACAVGAFVGGGAIALGLLKRRQPMPFGPFLALGALLAVFWGDAIIATYMSIFFPLAYAGWKVSGM
ncbi:prepilin peptidase [Leptothermofonsia sp. ETS-13]|uniref:prepilin peptidase n=1 Tax=Leptothermofonsia sp. ETS-13 TaxID=3035696 RepID=UPI003BA245A2